MVQKNACACTCAGLAGHAETQKRGECIQVCTCHVCHERQFQQIHTHTQMNTWIWHHLCANCALYSESDATERLKLSTVVCHSRANLSKLRANSVYSCATKKREAVSRTLTLISWVVVVCTATVTQTLFLANQSQTLFLANQSQTLFLANQSAIT
jgi:hypothetical protein